tara:strand:+ start:41466 stop:44885 length:3420 start_codon:yes stop_codon:yes gene_type:complete
MPETTVLPGEKTAISEEPSIPERSELDVNLPSIGKEPPIIEEEPPIVEEVPPVPEEEIPLPEDVAVPDESIPDASIDLEISPTDAELETIVDELDSSLSKGKTQTPDEIEQTVDDLDSSAGQTHVLGTDIPISINELRQTLYAGMADAFDMPYDAAMTLVNAALTGTGLDKILGTVPLDGFRRVADYYGISLPEDKIPDSVLADVVYFLGQSLSAQGLLGSVLKNVGKSSIDVAFSKVGGANAKSIPNNILKGWPKALLPKGWQNRILSEKVSLKEAAKLAANTIKDTAVRNPIVYGVSEVLASMGAGGLYGIAKRVTDDPTVQLFAGLVGAVVPTTAIFLIKNFMFGGLRIVWESGRTLFPIDAYPRSAKRLQGLVKDPEKALKNLEGESGGPTTLPKKEQKGEYTDDRALEKQPDESILPELESAMNPIQKARSGSSINAPQVIRDLLPLEKSILNSDINLARKGDHQRAALNDILVRSMSEPQVGDIKLTKQELRKQRLFVEETVTARFKEAQQNAEAAIKKAGPKLDRTAANKIAGAELEAALKDTRLQETILWNATDDAALASKSTGRDFEFDEAGTIHEVITSPLIDAWRNLLKAKGSTADPSDYKFSGAGGSDLYKQLGHFNARGQWIKGTMRQLVTLKDLQVFRSRMLDEIRGEKAKLNSGNKRRIFGELQSSIMKMFELEEGIINMKMVDGVFVASESERRLLKAISFSRMLNDRFNKGEVSKILGSNKDGSFKVDEALTLQSLIGKGVNAEERAVNFKKFIIAIERENTAANILGKKGEDADLDALSIRATLEAGKAYIKGMFFDEFVVNGVITERSASKWLKDNRETLKQIPGLKKELDTVMTTGKTALLREHQNEKMRTLLRSPERSMTVFLAEHEPMALFGREGQFSSLSQRQFEAQIDKLMFKVSKDTSGGATSGAQQSVFDWVLSKSVLIGAENSKTISATQQNIFSGFQMSRILNDPKNAYIFKKVLTPEQNERLGLILRSALEVDAIRHAEAIPGQKIMNDIVGGLLNNLARILGASVGGEVAGFVGKRNIQTPGLIASKFAALAKVITKDYAKQLLIKAATDENPELFIAIMKKIQTTADEKYVEKHLHAYLATLMSRENIPFPKEDFYGKIEQETTEPPQ